MGTHLDDTTKTEEIGAVRAPAGLQLRVVATSGALLLPLPARGAVAIGRSEECDLRIDDKSVSRRHATLHIDGSVQLEDHGSANGTRVRGAPLAPNAKTHVSVGDVIEFGTVLCALVGSAAPERSAATDGIVVADVAMERLHKLLGRIADGAVHVLLLGETGVGKEVFAAQLHARSPRRDKAFVKINCGALPENLIEAELFGYEKGAFSGAVNAKPGLMETAEGGTLFLDEVGELSLTTQARLLRVLEDREVRRVGAVKSRAVDVRIVAATNRDLEAEISAGRYRSDLYFRLNGFALTIPPLRERVREIAPLALHLARVAASQSGRSAPTITPEAMRILEAWRWPGNIRELRNVMARAVLLSSNNTITPEHLPLDKMLPPATRPSGSTPAATEAASAPPTSAPPVSAAPSAALPDDLRDAMAVVERQRILDALDRCAGNQTRAATQLGISRRALVSKLELYNLPRPRKREG